MTQALYAHMNNKKKRKKRLKKITADFSRETLKARSA
jgi:hypothetical protein